MSEWKEYKLEEVCELIVDCVNRTAPTVDYVTPYKMIRTTNVKNGKIDVHDVRYVTEETYKNWIRRGKPEIGDIILTREAPVGDIGLVRTDDKIFLGQRTMMYRPNSKLADSDFLYYSFLTASLREQIIGAAMGSVVEHIRVPDAKEFKVQLPMLSEQISISSILRSLDDKLELLNRQNKTLEAIAETLFRQWFEEEAEDSWEVGKLEDEFDFVMGQSPNGSDLNELKEGVIFYQGRSDFGFRFPKPRIYTTAPKRFAQKFDTLVSVRAPVGDMNMAIEECCLGRGVAAFRYKQNPKYYSYTYYKMRSLIELIKQFEDNGSIFGSIGKDDFKKIENVIPTTEWINKFQREAESIDKKIYNNSAQIISLTLLRDSLLPKLMNGEVIVKI